MITKQVFCGLILVFTLLLCFSSLGSSHGHGHGHGHDFMSPMRLVRSIDSDLVVMVAQTTQGPYFEDLTDYVNTSNVLTAAKKGGPSSSSSGLTSDRNSVLDGFPLNLTINVYSVDEQDSIANELQWADVYLWHCDAVGIYSAVDSAGSTQSENTVGQKWLRGVQNTGKTGSVTFQTILPGWYTGRILHFHIRVHLQGATDSTFVITTQFFVSQTDTDTIKVLSPYVSNRQTLIPYSQDNVYNSVSTDIRDKLILVLLGSPTSGYKSTFNMGIDLTSGTGTSTGASPTTSTNGGPPPTGTPGSTNGGPPPTGIPGSTTTSTTGTTRTSTGSLTSGTSFTNCEDCETSCKKHWKTGSEEVKKQCKKDCKKANCKPHGC